MTDDPKQGSAAASLAAFGEQNKPSRAKPCWICALPDDIREVVDNALSLGSPSHRVLGLWLHTEMGFTSVKAKTIQSRISHHSADAHHIPVSQL